MKKSSVLWLLPLAAALFICVPSNLSALPERDERRLVELRREKEEKGTLSRSKERQLIRLEEQKSREIPLGNSPVGSGAVKTIVTGRQTPATVRFNSGMVPDYVRDMSILKDQFDIDLDTEYVGIGSAAQGEKATDSQRIQIAEARARQDIVFQQGVQATVTISDLWANESDASGETVTSFREDIEAYQISKAESLAVTVVTRDRLDDGTWWVVVTYPKKPGSMMTRYQTRDELNKRIEEAFRQLDEESLRLQQAESRVNK